MGGPHMPPEAPMDTLASVGPKAKTWGPAVAQEIAGRRGYEGLRGQSVHLWCGTTAAATFAGLALGTALDWTHPSHQPFVSISYKTNSNTKQ